MKLKSKPKQVGSPTGKISSHADQHHVLIPTSFLQRLEFLNKGDIPVLAVATFNVGCCNFFPELYLSIALINYLKKLKAVLAN